MTFIYFDISVNLVKYHLLPKYGLDAHLCGRLWHDGARRVVRITNSDKKLEVMVDDTHTPNV